MDVDTVIATRKPGEYAAAATLLADLRTLADRGARLHEFTQRCAVLRQDHARKSSLLDLLNHANL